MIGTRLLWTTQVRDYVIAHHRKRYDKLINAIFRMMKDVKKGSPNKWIIYALFSKPFGPAMLLQFCDQHGVGKIVCLFDDIRKKSKVDFDILIAGNSKVPQTTTRQHVHDEILLEVIAFVLHNDHIATISWGIWTFNLWKIEKVGIHTCRKLLLQNCGMDTTLMYGEIQ